MKRKKKLKLIRQYRQLRDYSLKENMDEYVMKELARNLPSFHKIYVHSGPFNAWITIWLNNTDDIVNTKKYESNIGFWLKDRWREVVEDIYQDFIKTM
jgi:hypothetical protein